MSKTTPQHEAPTRREYVKYGGTIIGGGLLAGCVSENPSEELEDTDSGEPSEDTSYAVEIEPPGEISFEEVPETYVSWVGDWAEMAAILGRGDGFQAVVDDYPSYFIPEELADEIGLEINRDLLTLISEESIDKEVFYEINADLHFLDRGNLANFGINEADVEEISENIGPVCGHDIFVGDSVEELPYERYTMYEAFETVAQIFREQAKFEAFEAVHDEMIAEIDQQLSSQNDRLTVAFLSSPPDNNTFFFATRGTTAKPYRDLKVRDALSDVEFEPSGARQIDYETLLEIDPDLISFMNVAYETDSNSQFEELYVTPMEEHPIGQQLTAVANDRIVPGPIYIQGPATNLFQTELVARTVYPEIFDEFEGIDAHPDVPEDEQLFDRDEVADIINGDL
jgi:iron complex transport system substrate-binding protein